MPVFFFCGDGEIRVHSVFFLRLWGTVSLVFSGSVFLL